MLSQKKENTKRPPDTNLSQQRLPTIPGKPSTMIIAITMMIIGIVFLILGNNMYILSHKVYEQTITYDDGSVSACNILNSNEGKQCQMIFTFDQDVTGPLYFYYGLENFYQNHRRYYKSLSRSQLQGQVLSENDVSLDCTPLYKNGSTLLNPCGLIANSFFTDMFSVNPYQTSGGSSVTLNDQGIALRSDRETLFKQVSGFSSVQVPNATVSCTYAKLPSNCKSYYDEKTGLYYKFYYPNDDTTQYLYETYPEQISPIDGVTNEHFIVWMRTPMMPTFRKLYGIIHSDFSTGEQLAINITANFEVGSFNAEKSITVSTIGELGAKNNFIGQAYITIGSIGLTFGLIAIIGSQTTLFHWKLH